MSILPSRFSERVQQGALGVELWDALRQLRIGTPIGVSIEAPPPPIFANLASWLPGAVCVSASKRSLGDGM